MKIQDFVANKKLMAEYKRWINADIAPVVFAMLQETFCRPILPGQIGEHINQSTSEFALGEVSGSWKMLDGIRGVDEVKIPDELVPETYGVEVTKKEGKKK